jgi:hypothetical protein
MISLPCPVNLITVALAVFRVAMCDGDGYAQSATPPQRTADNLIVASHNIKWLGRLHFASTPSISVATVWLARRLLGAFGLSRASAHAVRRSAWTTVQASTKHFATDNPALHLPRSRPANPAIS